MADDKQIIKDFFHYVNMTADELKRWLDNPQSMNTGQAAEDGEPKGHKSGRQILEILQKKDKNYTPEEIKHMQHCNSYNKRHLAQGPQKGDPEHSRWRYSHLNWGCDPMKKPLGDRDYSKVTEDDEGEKAKDEKPSSPKKSADKKASSPKKGAAKKDADDKKDNGKEEEKESSPQKRKADKQEDDDSKKQKTK